MPSMQCYGLEYCLLINLSWVQVSLFCVTLSLYLDLCILFFGKLGLCYGPPWTHNTLAVSRWVLIPTEGSSAGWAKLDIHICCWLPVRSPSSSKFSLLAVTFFIAVTIDSFIYIMVFISQNIYTTLSPQSCAVVYKFEMVWNFKTLVDSYNTLCRMYSQ